MKKVLMVEDDKELTLALGMRLKAMGYEMHSAADAVSAVSVARQAKPDVVLIDYNLPGGSGFMVAERLRTLLQTSATPFVIITASKEAGLREKALELGASAFLEKPFDATRLADAIEGALGNAA